MRLLLRIDLPLTVFIRARKPCLFLRLRLLGWYVLFISSARKKPGKIQKEPQKDKTEKETKKTGINNLAFKKNIGSFINSNEIDYVDNLWIRFGEHA